MELLVWPHQQALGFLSHSLPSPLATPGLHPSPAHSKYQCCFTLLLHSSTKHFAGSLERINPPMQGKSRTKREVKNNLGKK